MARKNGGWNKFLNFIGLVDDEEPNESYQDDNGYEDDYGARSSYTPNRSRTARPSEQRPQMARRYNDGYEPTRAPRQDRGGRGPAPSRDGRNSRFAADNIRANSRFAQQSSGYDYTPRSAQPSRFDDRAARNEANAVRLPRNAAQQRTIMFTLKELTDCRDVIDNLVLDTTVVLTIDASEEIHNRALDILSGATFALQAYIRKASPYTYLLAPKTVDIDETT